ncbi:unnamed protein product [Candidula unifasciata]|uniref:Transmembrane protein n=1 Tax=Candidula unifasciata TaxID=100452 RepID=A0A8S3ZXU7_9EUPU|nr:unnamed protein product [Candidula unifasciata]
MANNCTDKLPPIKLPSWLSEKWVMSMWIGSFSILVILSCFIFIPVAITMTDTDGNCLLYADSREFGALSVCSYCVAIAVIFLSVCCLRLTLLILKLTRFSSKIEEAALWFSIWGVHIAIFGLDLLLVLLLLVSSCLLSAGLSRMCEDLFKGRTLCASEYGIELSNGDILKTFYLDLTMAEGAAWMTFVYWSMIVALESLILWKNETIVNTANQVLSFVRRK